MPTLTDSMLIAGAFIEGVTLFAEVVCIIIATSKA